MHVEGAAHTGIGDNLGEDIRAVDLVAQPRAAPDHVGQIWIVHGWEAGRHCLPEQLEYVRVDSRQSVLDKISMCN